jgi:16S rRNA (guanine966-N2)-methyltransferase
MTDRAREGLFASLGDAVVGARVLDLFAGTGALGIEALSRGAARAVFVDSAPAAAAAIRENLRRTRLEERGAVWRVDALRAVRRLAREGPFDLVLVDPPYRLPRRAVEALLSELAARGAVAPGGTVVLSRPRKSSTPVIPLHWRVIKELSYGDSAVVVLRVPQSEGGR